MSKFENVGLLKQRVEDYNACDKVLCDAYDMVHGQKELLSSYIDGLDEESELFQKCYLDIGEAIDHIYDAQESLVHAISALRFTRSIAEENLTKILNE